MVLLRTFYYAARNIWNYWKATKLDKIVDVKLRQNNKKIINIAIHGSLQNHASSFYDMFKWFDKKGILIVPIKYDYNLSLKQAAAAVKKQIHEVLKKSHAHKINIIAHSYGGLVARYYVQELGGSKVTNKLITIGTVHYGPKINTFKLFLLAKIPNLLKKEELAGSKITARLNKTDKFRNHVAIIGTADNLILPNLGYYKKARKNIYAKGVSHIGELHDSAVFEVILKEIKQ